MTLYDHSSAPSRAPGPTGTGSGKRCPRFQAALQEEGWARLCPGVPTLTPQCGLGQLGTLVTLGTCAVAMNSFFSLGMPLAYE